MLLPLMCGIFLDAQLFIYTVLCQTFHLSFHFHHAILYKYYILSVILFTPQCRGVEVVNIEVMWELRLAPKHVLHSTNQIHEVCN